MFQQKCIVEQTLVSFIQSTMGIIRTPSASYSVRIHWSQLLPLQRETVKKCSLHEK